MVSKDEEKMYVEFCTNYLLRAMRNSKQRYMRNERKKISECILNAKDVLGEEYGESIIGAIDIDFDEFLKFPENIENEHIYIAYKNYLKLKKM